MYTEKNPRYISPDDAMNRLHDTVMMYNNEPVYLQCQRSYEYSAFKLSSGSFQNALSLHVKTVGHDVLHATIPLGFMNIEVNDPFRVDAYYLSRTAMRQTREGLTNNNVSVLQIGDVRLPNRVLTQTFWKPLNDTIVGNYPTARKVFEVLSKAPDGSSIAFDRQFAVYLKGTDDEPQLSVYWRNNMIGFVHFHDGVFKGDPIHVALLPAYLKNVSIVDTLRRYNFVI